MSDLKKLQLDRDKINSSMESFSENIKIKNIEEKGLTTLYTIEIDNTELKLSFYFNKIDNIIFHKVKEIDKKR